MHLPSSLLPHPPILFSYCKHSSQCCPLPVHSCFCFFESPLKSYLSSPILNASIAFSFAWFRISPNAYLHHIHSSAVVPNLPSVFTRNTIVGWSLPVDLKQMPRWLWNHWWFKLSNANLRPSKLNQQRPMMPGRPLSTCGIYSVSEW